jgi:phosphate transport system ATP-binding protein
MSQTYADIKREGSSPSTPAEHVTIEDVILKVEDLNVSFGSNHVLKNINIAFKKNVVTAIIGPSGCGKSTFLRSINLMNGLYDNCKLTGRIVYKDANILEKFQNVYRVRKDIGMVFQKPNPFPKTIFENITFGPTIHRMHDESMDVKVERILKAVALWDEVKDRLKESAMTLSGGQQQRLCIARALAVEPEIILMDEPCSALDPQATTKIEDLISTLKKDYTVIIVTHNMQQAARVSDYTAFLYLGELVEYGETREIFEAPKSRVTENYITGRFG